MNPSMSSAKALLSQVGDKTTDAKLNQLGAYSINCSLYQATIMYLQKARLRIKMNKLTFSIHDLDSGTNSL